MITFMSPLIDQSWGVGTECMHQHVKLRIGPLFFFFKGDGK